LPLQTARAATCTVTSSADSGSGSLRDRIGDSSCSAITFNGDMSILVDSSLTIGHDLTLDGTGHSISISGQNLYQVFVVNSGVTASLANLTITQGAAPGGEGGGLLNNGSLTLTKVTFDGNNAGNGGAVASYGPLTVTDSTFSSNQSSESYSYNGGGAIDDYASLTVTGSTFTGNVSGWVGGGINQHGGTSITVTSSTFVDNQSYAGGGIYLASATLTVANSTFTGDEGYERGGGVFGISGSTMSLFNDTFSGNSADWYTGSDVFFGESTTLNYANTILAHSVHGADCSSSGAYFARIGTNRQNLVQDDSCGPAFSGDPDLGPLANNGGPTETMALLAGSPAIDAGDAATCSASPVSDQDQRGVTRPQGARCDIGAYEYGPVIPRVTASTPAVGAAVASPNFLTVTFNQDMRNDGSAKAANNLANYLLLQPGTDGVFETLSCQGGRLGDDVSVPIASVSYSVGTQTATLTPAASLRPGTYRLLVCGTTSIWSVPGLELNNGSSDTQIDFSVTASVPATGFDPGQVTALGPQETFYAALGDLWLEIPRLGVRVPIVGVPQSPDGSWDLSWLGNDAGWLNGTAFPTWPGNSVLTGHVYNSTGLPGPFLSLNTLAWGDPVIVHAFGAEDVYGVRQVLQVAPEDVSAMLQHEDGPWLTIVTCRGYDPVHSDYGYRILVRAVLVQTR